jgi:CRISPR-associated protein Csb1
LQAAFKAVLRGDSEPLAKIAPTSLVFGVWDSRNTQAKLPRLIASTIRGYDVQKLTRSAQYVPATEYIDQGLLEDTDDKKQKDAYAMRGFIHVPASGAHGGVIAHGGIRRDAALNLAALRLLVAGSDKKKTRALQRYILGLALIALTYSRSGYLRQGCSLVLDPERQREFKIVYGDGRREDTAVTHAEAIKYAKAAAEAFGVGQRRDVEFDKDLARSDINGDGADGGKPAKKSSKKK